jgi:hypothetical protein
LQWASLVTLDSYIWSAAALTRESTCKNWCRTIQTRESGPHTPAWSFQGKEEESVSQVWVSSHLPKCFLFYPKCFLSSHLPKMNSAFAPTQNVSLCLHTYLKGILSLHQHKQFVCLYTYLKCFLVFCTNPKCLLILHQPKIFICLHTYSKCLLFFPLIQNLN